MFIFGTVSRLQPIKNQKLMINAFARIHEKYPQTHLLIVGDGEARKELEMLVSQLQLESSVTFTGFQKDPYRFYQIFDIVLLSSFSEGLSMTLIEAMAASRPAVVTNVGGNAEVVTDGENGLVVESDNVPLFTNAMEKSLINQIDLKVMGEHSRKKYLEQFSIENMVEKMMSIYIGK